MNHRLTCTRSASSTPLPRASLSPSFCRLCFTRVSCSSSHSLEGSHPCACVWQSTSCGGLDTQLRPLLMGMQSFLIHDDGGGGGDDFLAIRNIASGNSAMFPRVWKCSIFISLPLLPTAPSPSLYHRRHFLWSDLSCRDPWIIYIKFRIDR